MSVIALTSASGAPGVTTAAVALATNWPKRVFLIEADTSKTTSIIPGAFRGQLEHTKGLTEAAVAVQRRELTPNALLDQTVEFAPDRYFIPGFRNLRGAASAGESFWRALLDATRPWETTGADILIDLGRLRVDDHRLPLLLEADSVTLLADRSLPAFVSLLQLWRTKDRDRQPNPEWLLTALAGVGHESYVDLVTIDRPIPQETWSAREISGLLGVHLLGTLPWDPAGSLNYALGTPAKKPRSAYNHAVSGLLHAYEDTLDTRTFKGVLEREGQR